MGKIFACGIRKPRVQVPLKENPEWTAWNPESKTVLDYLTPSETKAFRTSKRSLLFSIQRFCLKGNKGQDRHKRIHLDHCIFGKWITSFVQTIRIAWRCVRSSLLAQSQYESNWKNQGQTYPPYCLQSWGTEPSSISVEKDKKTVYVSNIRNISS